MASALDVSGVPHNPIDLIEEMVAANDWPFDRSNEQELVVGINADWCTYHLWFAWRHEPGVLHLCCAFDLKVPEERRRDVSTLVARINDSIWLGHFAMNDERSSVMFRHGQVMFAESDPLADALRNAHRDRAQRMRTLLSGLSVRHLGRQEPDRRDRGGNAGDPG